MSRFLRRTMRNNHDIDANEPIADTSADLAYELQSKMFDQLATVGIAGAGLAVTLIGSVLQDEPNDVWLSVVFFGIAAVTAISGNQRLVDGLTVRQPCLRRAKRDMQIALTLIGVAIGWLSMSVYAKGTRQAVASENVVATPPVSPGPLATR
jgi:hypothetical protein